MSVIVNAFGQLGENLTRFTERWIPDSWVVCMILTLIAMVLAMTGASAGLEDVVLAWGGGMWILLELAMQFTLALIAAHACVSSKPMFRFLDRLAGIPNPNRPLQAIVLMGIYSIFTGYLNWALTIVASALFVPFVMRRNPKADIRLLIAGAYLGMGTVWHGGLSGSAPLILATPGNPLVSPSTGSPVIDRIYPITETLFIPFNLTYLVVVSIVGLGMLVLLHPRKHPMTLSPEEIESRLPILPNLDHSPATPAGKLEMFRGWVLLAAVLIAYPLGHSFVTKGFGATWTINGYNMVFLTAALLLHGRPASIVRAVQAGVGNAAGVIFQFPFYAGIFGVINNTGLGDWLGQQFVSVASTSTFPLIVYLYSGLVNLFVPSGGSKWLIEAPYLLPAAQELGVSVTTTLLAYSYGDSTSNMIQPFWAIPILAVARLRFGDVVGYTFLIGVALFLTTVAAMLLIPTNL